MRVKDDLARALTGQWKVDMFSAPCSSPCKFCCGMCIPCCFAHSQRGKILDVTGEQYLCCGGSCPCCQQPCQDREPWMCLEACCCLHVAIMTNRFMIQTRFDIQNDACDDTLLGVTACINILADCAAIVADRGTAEHLHHCADCVNTVVCSCMLTQQAIQLEAIEEELAQRPYGGPPQHIVIVLPPTQQTMVQATQALRMNVGGAPPPLMAPFAAGLPMAGQLETPRFTPPGMAPAMQVMPQPQLQAQGRQIWLTVPQGYQPGMPVPFSTDDGRQMTAAVPAGHFAGQQFAVQT